MKRPYLCLGCLILFAAACKQEREIKVYHVAKETVPGSAASIAAIT